MFSDALSLLSPSEGVQVSHGDDAYEPLWETSMHYVSFPWTMDSGFRTMEGDYIKFWLGSPDRTALIWGMHFMKEQVIKKGTISMRIAYNYYKDSLDRGLYGYTDKRSPVTVGLGHETHSISISWSDLDVNGLYFFKHPDNPSQPLKFVASEIMLELRSGYLNFDFLGSFYDYDTAWDGKNSDNKDDNFNERVIGSFWIIGNSFIFFNVII